MKSLIFLPLSQAVLDQQPAPENCKTNELRCRAAVVNIPTCFAYKTNVVTDVNKQAEFDRHESDFNEKIKALISDEKHYYDCSFQLTEIVPKYPDDVNNYVIDQINQVGRLFFEVETTEAVMKICGNVMIKQEEFFGEDLKEDQYWIDSSQAWVESVEHYDSSEAASLNFYYINNPVDCFVANGGCSHGCDQSQCTCPPCWTIDLEGKTCHPNKGTIRTTCLSDAIEIEVDECVVDGYSMEKSKFESGNCAATETEAGSGIWKIKAGLDECGTTKEFVDGAVHYQNKLFVPPDTEFSMIFFSRPLSWTFTCEYEMSASVTSTYNVKAAKRRTEFNVNQGAFDFGINFFTGRDFKTIEDDQSSTVGQPVYYNIAMNGGRFLDGVEFRVTDCTGTPLKIQF